MGYSLAQVNDRNGLVAMCVVFSITSIMAVALRFYARRLKGLQLQADDWLIASALVHWLSSTLDYRRCKLANEYNVLRCLFLA